MAGNFPEYKKAIESQIALRERRSKQMKRSHWRQTFKQKRNS